MRDDASEKLDVSSEGDGLLFVLGSRLGTAVVARGDLISIFL